MKIKKRVVLILLSLVSVLFGVSAGAADFSSPLIDLPKVKIPNLPSTPVRVRAIVDDDSGVESVYLYYRALGEAGKAQKLPMRATTENPKMYEVEMPMEATRGGGFEYYVEARDIANNVSQEPFPNKPRQVLLGKSHTPVEHNRRYFHKGWQWGWGVSYGNFTVDDPDGSTGSANTTSLAGILSYTPDNVWRVWAELGYHQFTLPYTERKIGQEVRSIHLDVLLQKGIPVFDGITWFGLGLGFAADTFEDRANSSNDVVTTEYPDRSGTNLSVIADLGYEIGPVRDKMLGLDGKIYMSQEHGLQGASLGLFMLF